MQSADSNLSTCAFFCLSFLKEKVQPSSWLKFQMSKFGCKKELARISNTNPHRIHEFSIYETRQENITSTREKHFRKWNTCLMLCVQSRYRRQRRCNNDDNPSRLYTRKSSLPLPLSSDQNIGVGIKAKRRLVHNAERRRVQPANVGR